MVNNANPVTADVNGTHLMLPPPQSVAPPLIRARSEFFRQRPAEILCMPGDAVLASAAPKQRDAAAGNGSRGRLRKARPADGRHVIQRFLGAKSDIDIAVLQTAGRKSEIDLIQSG